MADKKPLQPEDGAGEHPDDTPTEPEVCEVGTHPPPEASSDLLAAPSAEVFSSAEEGAPAEEAPGGAPPPPPPAENEAASPTEETPEEADAEPEPQPVRSRHLVSSAGSLSVSEDPSASVFCVFSRITPGD